MNINGKKIIGDPFKQKNLFDGFRNLGLLVVDLGNIVQNTFTEEYPYNPKTLVEWTKLTDIARKALDKYIQETINYLKALEK